MGSKHGKVVVMCDVMWLRHMHLQQEGTIGVLEIEDASEVIDDAVTEIVITCHQSHKAM